MRITEELIRRKSEHNEDLLEKLEEIALHQLEIEKIELIDRLCKDLKILLLQNNLIERLENLGRLKQLEYLNVALNNIVLDLTVNFIGLECLEISLENLRRNDCLEDLYLMGNPCAEWKGYRHLTIAMLPQLKQLDGKAVTPVERIEALRSLAALREDLRDEIRPNDSPDAYTRENRRRMYLEMTSVKSFEPYNSKGEIRQCNEGRLKFTIDHCCKPGQIVATFHLPRHLSTTLIDVDVHPEYLRVAVKGKITQLRLPDIVSPDASTYLEFHTPAEELLEDNPPPLEEIVLFDQSESPASFSKLLHSDAPFAVSESCSNQTTHTHAGFTPA
ncbi:protein tilB homolog [Cyclospora cayetanensis]|uniref:Protein tilB homolog n=1 Tax=Cyclospora cayetanensis TaxID=88456 RepID=A0A6P6RUI4_9EIME|nr:protein tilB homolog [Cyclospora cayetanensis]